MTPPSPQGKKVVVVGGGNVAMDAARTALRLGAEVHIVYRRSEAELPARVEEVHHAKEEGVIFDLLQQPDRDPRGREGLGKGHAHASRWSWASRTLPEEDVPSRSPAASTRSTCDTVIMSLGTSPNPLISSTTKGLDVNRRGCIIAEDSGATSKEGGLRRRRRGNGSRYGYPCHGSGKDRRGKH